jgi:predicted transcriptional regulator
MALLYIKGPATVTDICETLADHKMPRSFGWVYTALNRMIQKKLVTRRKGELTFQRGGKSRYLYKITSGGRVAVNEAHKAPALWSRTAKGR